MDCKAEKFEQIKTNVRITYSWLSDEDMNICLNLAIGDYIRIRFNSADNITPDDIDYDFATISWLEWRMRDILSRAGASIVSYKENGLNFTYGSSFIDENLANQIIPEASIPK